MSLLQQAWWPKFCGQLVEQPLDVVARGYNISAADGLAALLEATPPEVSVTEAPWWPEAVRRLKAGASLRELSRTFNANLRRLRRGLARAGIRVAGQDVGEDGVHSLDIVRDRLGKISDADAAEIAGVTVEAVQGERRRLNIEPFRPHASSDLPPEADDAPPPADDRRGDNMRMSARTDARMADARMNDARDRGAQRRWGWDEPEGEMERPVRPARSPRVWRRSDAPEPTVIRRPSSSGRMMNRTTGTPRPADEAPQVDRAAEDRANALEAAARERRGRLRLVRPDAINTEPLPEPVVREPRKRREPTYSPVRMVTVDETERARLEPATELPVAPSYVPAPAPVSAPVPAPPISSALPAPAYEAPRARVEPVRPAPIEVVADLPPSADDAPIRPIRRVEPRRVASARPEPVVAPVAAPVVETGPRFGWLVHISGRPAPILVVARDIATAAQLAASKVGSANLGAASIVMLGPEL